MKPWIIDELQWISLNYLFLYDEEGKTQILRFDLNQNIKEKEL